MYKRQVGKPDRKGATELMHIIAAQVAANNCYTDVKMVFIYDKDQCIRREDWECMNWFPHVWNQVHKTRYLAVSYTHLLGETTL